MYRKATIIFLLLIGMLVLVACSAAAPISTTSSNDPSSTQEANAGNGPKVNLNTASGDEFMSTIPGLGNRMVREFMEYRPYISIQQFRREIGKYVDDAQVAEYEKYVYVPVAINDSDSETLQQISGLSAEEASALISARPFTSTGDFLTKLSEYLSADELETAKSYLGAN